MDVCSVKRGITRIYRSSVFDQHNAAAALFRYLLLLLAAGMGDKRYRVGGTRGGQDQFKWDDVKADAHRENYLGHSLLAPVGRWQRGEREIRHSSIALLRRGRGRIAAIIFSLVVEALGAT